MTRVRFLGPDTDAYVASVERHAREFEEQSAIELEVRIVPSDLYFSNRIEHLLDGDDAADVFMSGPVLLWEHLASGFVQPLDDLLERASDTYDADDFFDPLLRCNRWTGRFGDPLGDGPLLEIPVNCESYNLAYVPEVLDRAGVDVPGYLGAVLRHGAAGRRADERRGARLRPARHRTLGTRCTRGSPRSCGRMAPAISSTAGARIASPESVRATTDFLAALGDAGPTDWLEQRWYELAMDFGRGRYGLIVDSDHYVAFFEDPATSDLAGGIGYALPPVGPTGERRPNLWTWSVVMNSRARDRETAWRFIEWATGAEFLHRSTFEGNMNPTRRSIWDDERFRAHTASWGAFHDVARTLIEHEAAVLVTPALNYIAIATRWVEALLDAFTGRADVEEALVAAAADIDALT